MIDDTVLVVDADHDTEEKIVSTLEAEGYLVFTASGRDVSTGMAEKISPALIYLKPAANSVEGFEVCKAIHNMEKYRNVPIILLASLRGPLDSRYTTFYGVVDYLKMPLSSVELIEMTEKILGSRSRDLAESGEEDIGLMEEASVLAEEKPAAVDLSEMPEEETAAEEEMPVTRGSAAFVKEFSDMSEVGQPNEDYSYRDSKEDSGRGLLKRDRIRRRKKNSLLSPVVVVTAVIALVAAGFLSYKFFISAPEVKAPVAVITPKAVEQQEPTVLPPLERQKQEQPALEAKPAEIKKVPKEAPAQKAATTPVQKPAQAPAPVAATKPVAKTVYSVQLGAFKGRSAAEALVKTYKMKGYEVFTRKGTTDKGAFYRVLIGEFENRKEALRLAARIETKEKIKTAIFSEGTR
jgi:cell division septation protein DedD/FixJ family two-component response regulator